MTELMPEATGRSTDSPEYRRYAEFQRLSAEHAFDYRSVDNPAWFTEANGGRTPLPERLEFQNAVLEQWRAQSPDVATDRQAYVIIGPPGVGKTSVRHDIIARTQTMPSDWRMLDADELRDRMLTTMRDNGQLDELVQREAQDFGPSPREQSSQLVTESGKLFQRAQSAAIKRGENVIIECAFAEAWQPSRLIRQMQKAGYEVHVASVDTTHDVALGRTVQRYYEGLADRDGSGLGGRCMPEGKMRAQFGEDDRAVAPGIARQVAEEQKVASLTEYHVAGIAAAPMLRGRGGPESGYRIDPASTHSYVRESPVQAAGRGSAAVNSAASRVVTRTPTPGVQISGSDAGRLATDGVAKASGATKSGQPASESARPGHRRTTGHDSPER